MLRVEIEWHDTGLFAAKEEWTAIDTLSELHTGTILTVGYLMLEGDDDVIVATSWDKATDKVFGVQVILKTAIVRMTVLRARKEAQ